VGISTLKVLKKETPVLIYTKTHRIDGVYHAHEGSRLLDDLNGKASKQFVPLTDVRVASVENEARILFESDFVAVNIRDITLLCPHPKIQRSSEEMHRASAIDDLSSLVEKPK
jgi:hypothetical protein